MEASPAIPGVVWGGFVVRAFALEGAGLVDGTAEAFFVVCGDGRLALSEDSVAVALALGLVLAAAVTAGEIAAELSGGMKGEDEVEGG